MLMKGSTYVTQGNLVIPYVLLRAATHFRQHANLDEERQKNENVCFLIQRLFNDAVLTTKLF
jgi:hypothetical protein